MIRKVNHLDKVGAGLKLVILGCPPAKNDHKRVMVSKTGRPFPYSTSRAKAFYKAVADQYELPFSIDGGVWRIRIDSYFDRRSLKDEMDDHPQPDVDSPVSIVMDALQRAGVIDDDTRFVELVARKHYDKENPRVEIELEEVDD